MAGAFLKNALISVFVAYVADKIMSIFMGNAESVLCGPGVNDFSWFHSYTGPHYFPPKTMNITAKFIPMEDGVELAADVYRSNLQTEDIKLPAIVHLTRYGRAFEMKAPFSYMNSLGRRSNPRTGKLVTKFFSKGYVWINVDVRGSGASSGVKTEDFMKQEVRDGEQVLSWAASQPWCNGKVVLYGAGMDGTGTLALAASGHEALKAVVVRSAPVDLYQDALYPGGLFNFEFAKQFQAFTKAIDLHQHYKDLMIFKTRLMMGMVSGVSLDVNGDKQKHEEVAKEHEANVNMELESKNAKYRDVGMASNFENVQMMMKKIAESNVPLYMFGGYFDMGVARGSLELFQQIAQHGNPTGATHRLTLGPWGHDGSRNVDAFSKEHVSCFQPIEEMARFLDYQFSPRYRKLTELFFEESIHYFTMVENVWKSTAVWPPAHMETKTYFLGHETLAENLDSIQDNSTVLNASSSVSSTIQPSRWNAMKHIFGEGPNYDADRTTSTTASISFVSEEATPMEFTGDAEIKLYFSVDKPDVAIYAYLEDLDDTSIFKKDAIKRVGATYITEAVLRPQHGLNENNERTFNREQSSPLEAGKVYQAVFKFLPVSYLFTARHNIRLTIRAAETKDFVLPDAEKAATKFTIHYGPTYPSSINLPLHVVPGYEPVENDIASIANVEDDEFANIAESAVDSAKVTKDEL